MRVRAKSIVHSCLVDESEHRSLSAGALYDVIGLDNDNFRLIDDDDQPFLFPKALFEIVDPSIPDDWMIYVLCFHEQVSHRVVRQPDVFLGVVALVILVSGLVCEPKRFLIRTVWAVAAPAVAMALLPYLLTYAWVLSLVLLALGEIDHRVIKRSDRPLRLPRP